MFRYYRLLFAVLTALTVPLTVAPAVYAGSAHTVVASQERLSIAQAAEKLRSKVGGRVLGAKVIEREGRALYEIKVLLKPGKIKVYWLDPASGAIL